MTERQYTMSYYLAPSLAQLRAQIDATWPSRSKASDGWIGDASHSARKSDHNPDYSAGGVVRAIDVTASGIDTDAVIAAAIADPRTSYIIHKGVIRGASQFKPRKYTGANAHNQHIHISIKSTKGAESGHLWKLGKGGNVKPAGKPSKPAKNPKGTRENRSIQTALQKMGLYKGVIDGLDQSMQKAAVKAFQKFHGLVVDGKWQAKTQAVFTLNKKVQKALRKQGYTKQVVDGYYGNQQTAPNVGDFQKRVGLVVDRLAGPKTLKALGIK